METLRADHSLRSTQTEAIVIPGMGGEEERRADPRDRVHCSSKPSVSALNILQHTGGLLFFILVF